MSVFIKPFSPPLNWRDASDAARTPASGQDAGLAVIGPDAVFRFAGKSYRAALGRSGISTMKHEGDGATPTGLLPLRRVLYRADRLPPPAGGRLPREPIAPTDAWCDDPKDPAYNQPVALPYAASHEEMWRKDEIYDVVGVLGWNDQPVIPGRGSAIFLHIARPDYTPTAGCIALALPDLRSVLAEGLTAIRVLPA